MFYSGHNSAAAHSSVVFNKVNDVINVYNLYGFSFRSQAARGKEGIKDGVSEMGTRLDPVPGLPGGESANTRIVCVYIRIVT